MRYRDGPRVLRGVSLEVGASEGTLDMTWLHKDLGAREGNLEMTWYIRISSLNR